MSSQHDWLGVPSSLVDLVRATTDKDPAQRPQDFGAVGRQIDEILAALAARNSAHKVRWALIGLLAVLLAFGLYALFRWQR